MSMTRDQVDDAVGDFILRAMGQDGGLRIISNPVVDHAADTVVFKIAVPAGGPLSEMQEDGSYTGGVAEAVQTVTLTVTIA